MALSNQPLDEVSSAGKCIIDISSNFFSLATWALFEIMLIFKAQKHVWFSMVEYIISFLCFPPCAVQNRPCQTFLKKFKRTQDRLF